MRPRLFVRSEGLGGAVVVGRSPQHDAGLRPAKTVPRLLIRRRPPGFGRLPRREGFRLKVLLGWTLAVLCACGGAASPDGGTANELAAGFAGTWGGPMVTRFAIGGELNLASVVYVTVSGGSASLSGVCPDGSGPMAVSGSGTSASFSGSLACPNVAISGCDDLNITYSQALLSLVSATNLELTVTGVANGCGLTSEAVSTFSGTLAAAGANPVPPWDLRFKGVGQSLTLQSAPKFGGGGIAGATNIFYWSGYGFLPGGLVAGGGFLVDSLYGPSQTAVYQDTLWVDGVSCPATWAAVMSGNNIVYALDGDPYQPNAVCIILGVGQPGGGPHFQYLSDEALSLNAIVEELTGSAAGRSFVLTTLFAVQPGLYTYIAESIGALADGGYEQFDTVIQTPLVADLASTAEALADAGYVITASAWQGEATYTLVGTRPVGSTASHSTLTMMTNDLTYFGDAQDMLKNGYVPVSFLQDYYALPDGGLGADTWLIGEN